MRRAAEALLVHLLNYGALCAESPTWYADCTHRFWGRASSQACGGRCGRKCLKSLTMSPTHSRYRFSVSTYVVLRSATWPRHWAFAGSAAALARRRSWPKLDVCVGWPGGRRARRVSASRSTSEESARTERCFDIPQAWPTAHDHAGGAGLGSCTAGPRQPSAHDPEPNAWAARSEAANSGC